MEELERTDVPRNPKLGQIEIDFFYCSYAYENIPILFY